MIVHTLRYQVGAQTVTGISEVCNRYGYGTMVCCSENDPAKEFQAIQLCLNQQVEGFVIVPAVEPIEPYQAICEKGTPVVLCTRNLPGWPYGSVYVRHERKRGRCHGRPDGDAGAGGNRRIAPRRTGTEKGGICNQYAHVFLVLRELEHRKVRIPDDLGVCGYDALGWSELVYPEISSIYQPMRQMGVQAGEKIIEALQMER